MNVVINLRVSALKIPVRVVLLVTTTAAGLAIAVQSAKALGLDPFGLVAKQARSEIMKRLPSSAYWNQNSIVYPLPVDGLDLSGNLAVQM